MRKYDDGDDDHYNAQQNNKKLTRTINKQDKQ